MWTVCAVIIPVTHCGFMRRPTPLPNHLGDAFSVKDALNAGITVSRLRSADLAAPFHGVRSASTLSDIASRAANYAPLLLPGQHFSHTTAAGILRLRMPEGFREHTIHVTSLAPDRAPRGRGITGHQTDRDIQLFITKSGLLVPHPIDVWCQLSTLLTLDDLIVMGDGLLCRKEPWATIDQLHRAVDQWHGMRGAKRLSAALPHVRARTDSARETALRLLIIRNGLPEPEVNGVIVNQFGAQIAHGDLVFRKYRTIIEYDGAHHRTDERQYHIDVERLDALADERWRVIRVNKDLLTRRATLLGRIRSALIAGGWDGTTLTS